MIESCAKLHGVIFRNTALLIFSIMRFSNLTRESTYLTSKYWRRSYYIPPKAWCSPYRWHCVVMRSTSLHSVKLHAVAVSRTDADACRSTNMEYRHFSCYHSRYWRVFCLRNVCLCLPSMCECHTFVTNYSNALPSEHLQYWPQYFVLDRYFKFFFRLFHSNTF
jgi:hypothetical protein